MAHPSLLAAVRSTWVARSAAVAPTWLRLLVSVGALTGLCAWLVPWGSFPVGYDVFRSLWIARTWAERGFPASLPPAAFTGLDRHFGDQQLAFDGLLALVGGRDLDLAWVPPLLWGVVIVQATSWWAAARALRRDASPWWILLLPALSQAWLFRCTTLRTMLLSSTFLYLLLVLVAVRGRGGALRPWWLALAAAGFCYCHGAVLLVPWLWCLAAIGVRIERGVGSLPWRDGPWLLVGMLVAGIARPDFPANLRVWFDLNLGTPWAIATGDLAVRPTELLPLPLADLLATEWTFLLATGWLLVLLLRRGRAACWAVAIPALFFAVAALLSRRMFELAAPLLLLALVANWRGTLSFAGAAAGFALAGFVHAPLAAAGAEANRMRELLPVSRWLRQRARPCDLVFVTDWGASSPLAWFTRDSGLRFSGAIDPVFLWSEDPAASRDWQAIKAARVAEPLQLVRQRFGARFVAFPLGDAAAGAPAGTTANSLRQAMGRELAAGRPVEAFVLDPERPQDPRNWVVIDLAPN